MARQVLPHTVSGWETTYGHISWLREEDKQYREFFKEAAKSPFTIEAFGTVVPDRRLDWKHRRVFIGRRLMRGLREGDTVEFRRDLDTGRISLGPTGDKSPLHPQRASYDEEVRRPKVPAPNLKVCLECEKQGRRWIKTGSQSRRTHLRVHEIDIPPRLWTHEAVRKHFREQMDGELTGEYSLYENVRVELERLFSERVGNCHLKVTDRGQFSYDLKDRVPDARNIVFAFLESRKAFPDLTGFVEDKTGGTDFITVEVKDQTIELDDIYQAKKYADLFGAKYGFLISDERLPPEIKRLNQVANMFYQFQSDWRIYFAQFDRDSGKIKEDSWFPEKPFK